MNNRKSILIALFPVVILAVSGARALALECPKMPEQVNKDWEVKVDFAVAKIGPVKGGELQTKTKNTTKDLLGRLPSADKIYIEQMMYSSYCSSLRDNKTISESEKGKLIRLYNNEVRKTIAAYKSSSSKNEKIYKKNNQKKQSTVEINQPTFSENVEKVSIIFGGGSMSQSIDRLRKAPFYPFDMNGFKPLKLYVEKNKLYSDVEVYGGSSLSPIKITHNKVFNIPPNWDLNSNDKALEIVDENKNPIYQYIYKTDTQIIINGIFPYPNGLMLAQESGFTINPRLPAEFKLQRIFKYPKWKYPGQFD